MTRKPLNSSIAIYPGTFDPITNGHLDLINRGLYLFDKVIVTIAINPGKEPLFSMEERRQMILDCFEQEERVEVDSVSGLLVEYAASRKAKAIIRGLRAVADFEYEYQMVGMNRVLDNSIETVFLMAEAQHQAIASKLVKEIARLGGDVSKFVTPAVNTALKERFGG